MTDYMNCQKYITVEPKEPPTEALEKLPSKICNTCSYSPSREDASLIPDNFHEKSSYTNTQGCAWRTTNSVEVMNSL